MGDSWVRGTIDFSTTPATFIGENLAGQWEWKVYHQGRKPVGGAERDEATARRKLAIEAGVPLTPVRKAGADFARQTVVSKGSSRGSGPKVKKGVVYVDRSGKRIESPALCVHGQRKVRCDDCGAMHCACPGTLSHQCEAAA
jgi:hypothetical protein